MWCVWWGAGRLARWRFDRSNRFDRFDRPIDERCAWVGWCWKVIVNQIDRIDRSRDRCRCGKPSSTAARCLSRDSGQPRKQVSYGELDRVFECPLPKMHARGQIDGSTIPLPPYAHPQPQHCARRRKMPPRLTLRELEARRQRAQEGIALFDAVFARQMTALAQETSRAGADPTARIDVSW